MKRHVVSEENESAGVKPDVGTFEESDSAMEDHGLAHFIINSDDDETLPRQEAIRFYQKMKGNV